MSVDVYLGIGSNVDREHNVRSALQALDDQFGPLAPSPVYETAAVGFDGDPFLNLVVRFSTQLTIEAVQNALRDVEHTHGRDRNSARYAPRTLDVDLLLFGDRIVNSRELTLPRGEITRHAFVLAPLADLAPDLIHPVLGISISALWKTLQQEQTPGEADLRQLDFRLV